MLFILPLHMRMKVQDPALQIQNASAEVPFLFNFVNDNRIVRDVVIDAFQS